MFPDLELNFNLLTSIDWNDYADKNLMEIKATDAKNDTNDDIEKFIEQQYEWHYEEDDYYLDYVHELNIGSSENVINDYFTEDNEELPF